MQIYDVKRIGEMALNIEDEKFSKDYANAGKTCVAKNFSFAFTYISSIWWI